MNDISIENARIIFRNFKGEGNTYNRPGDRNFCVIIEDPAFANELIEDGWNIKQLMPRDEQDDITYYLPVACKYGDYPPEIYLIKGRHKTLLDEESVDVLDYAEIENVDIIINPYNWTIEKKDGSKDSGVKAYVKKMYVTIVVDEFASKYEDLDD